MPPTSPPIPDYTPTLQAWMQKAEIPSFRALSQQTGISERRIRNLRKGQISSWRVTDLEKLAQVLQVTLAELLTHFGKLEKVGNQEGQGEPISQAAILRQEYDRLQNQLHQQREALWQEFQYKSLQTIESWLTFWPSAVHAFRNNPNNPNNPNFDPESLIRLIKPVEQLIQSWGIEAIAPVGTELPYDPQFHQLLQGTAKPGDLVKISHVGYCQGDKLIYRAKVKPI